MINKIDKFDNIKIKESKGSYKGNAAIAKFNEIYKNAALMIDTTPTLSEKAEEIIGKLEEMLKVKMTEKDFDSKGNLLILQMIKRSPVEMSPEQIKYVKDSSYKLYIEGTITLREYLDTVEWLSNYYKGEKIKEKCMDTVIDLAGGGENSTKKEENYGVI